MEKNMENDIEIEVGLQVEGFGVIEGLGSLKKDVGVVGAF